MDFKSLCLLLPLLTTICACKKEPGNIEVKKPLIEKGSASDPYDIRVNLDEFGSIQERAWFWGRNSDEIFVTTHKGPIRVDLRAEKAEYIASPGNQGFFVGKTHENSGILFFGKVQGIEGIYIYHFSNNKVEGLLPKSNGGRLHMAGNSIFYSTGALESIGPGCGAFSIGCSNAIFNNSFYHINTITKEYTKLPPDLMVVCFSKDGTKTLLTKQSDALYYVFDNQSRTITDSLGSLQGEVFYDGGSTFYYDNTNIKSYGQNMQTMEISLINAGTNEVLHKFPLTGYLFYDTRKWSADGSKLYYSSYIVNGKGSISIYDLLTRQEKTIWPFGANNRSSFALSDDNKKLLLVDGDYTIYIRTVQ